ncbi:hypothetical protein ABW19_dt0203687 [Dactylella cylindrospora]|nr:hypothetical protein ABW19_dt0203687 [Dactylella cylindrospora]
MRLWNEETTRPDFEPTLVTVQSVFMLGVTLAADGMDRLGGMFLNNGIRLTKEILLAQEPATVGSSKGKGKDIRSGPEMEDEEAARKYEYAKSITIWAAFNFQCTYDFVARCQHTMPVPDLPLPYLETVNSDLGLPPHPVQYDENNNPFSDLNFANQWRPYPYIREPEPNITRIGFHAHTTFHHILYEVSEKQSEYFNGEKQLSLADKKRFYEMLDQWKDNIPEAIQEGTCLSPSPTFTHAHFYVLMMDIHNSATKNEEDENPEELAAFKVESANRYNSAKGGLYRLLEVYNRQNTMYTMTQPLTFAMLIASQNAMGSLARITGAINTTPSDLGAIPTGADPYDEEHIATTFENTLNWICNASNSFVTIKIFARLMQLEAQRMKIPLSDKVLEKLRRLFQWEKADRAKWAEQMEKTQTNLTWGKKKTEANIVDMVKNLEELTVQEGTVQDG